MNMCKVRNEIISMRYFVMAGESSAIGMGHEVRTAIMKGQVIKIYRHL